ncbi:MAG: hypothetical protein ACXVVQ_00805 [Solirubrobacteraceae bacterium]
MAHRTAPLLIVLAAGGALAGCGGASHSAPAGGAASGRGATQGATTAGSGAGAAGALSADARSAATGDIPDNQVFLTFTARSAPFTIKYPEGWTQSGTKGTITFRDKNNLVRVLLESGAAPTTASVSGQLAALKRASPTLTFTAPRAVALRAGGAIRARYTTVTPPNPVTGRRVKLVVDRYELARGGRVAIVDLGTPVGVDNVDAYRMMIESFRWR